MAEELALSLVGALLAVAVPGGVRMLRRMRERRAREQAVHDAVCGVPPDPIRGLPGVPGMAARLASLEELADMLRERTAQLVPNHGASLYDRVTQIGQVLAEHIAHHPGPSDGGG